jgi:cytochrome c553
MNQISLKLFAFLSSLIFISAAAQAEGLTGDAAAGQKKNATCIGCHGIIGYQASFPEVYKVPKISQQNAKYIESALKAYKSGERRHPTMRSVAQSLTDQDIADLAAYYEQHGNKVAVAEQAVEPPKVVADLLTKGGCAGCHGDPLVAGAPYALATYEQVVEHKDRVVARAVESDTMPPGQALSETDQDLLTRWVEGGTPR